MTLMVHNQSGHTVCSSCGEVASEALFDFTPDTYSESPDDFLCGFQTKREIHVGTSQGFHGANELTFYNTCMARIDLAIKKYLKNGRNARLSSRTKELFYIAYSQMKTQKAAKQRNHYSRSKELIIGCMMIALKEQNLPYKFEHLNLIVDGDFLTESTVYKTLVYFKLINQK